MATLLNNPLSTMLTIGNTDELQRLKAAPADAADRSGATPDTARFTPAIVDEKLGELEVYKSVG